MEAITSSQKKDSGKERTIVERWRSSVFGLNADFAGLLVAVAIMVGGKLYPRVRRNLNKEHLLECPRR